jgi:L-seryl-tRNA(Ser) seleniumtransferase
VPLKDLAHLARSHHLLAIDDNGSGALLDTAAFGLAPEPRVQDSLAAGCDLTIFSGDKLLGGPQAGIIVGAEAAVARLARHPLARALRPDKLAVAALSATLAAYLRPDVTSTIPVWRMIAEPLSSITARASAFQTAAAQHGIRLSLVPGRSAVGGGSLPGETLPTTLLSLPRQITAARLLAARAPVLATTRDGSALLDLRTVLPEQESDLLNTLLAANRSRSGG